MKSSLFIFLILIPLSVFAGTLKELEEQLAAFKRTYDAQSGNVARSLSQIQEMATEFQGLNGRIDQSLHENSNQTKLIEDNQKRLEILEDKIAILSKQLEEIKTAGLLPAVQVKNLKEFQEYEKALSLLNADDFRGAAQSLRQFLSANPKSVIAENAQYWIGEAHYAMRDFPAAVTEFQKVVQKYPTGSKAASAMLKQGFSFYEMQSFEDSQAFLNKVAAKYPNTTEAARARDRLKTIDELLQTKAREMMEQKEQR